MTAYSPLPVGAIKTKVLILLIVLIICGVAGTVIFTHFLRKNAEKPDSTRVATLMSSANLFRGIRGGNQQDDELHHRLHGILLRQITL